MELTFEDFKKRAQDESLSKWEKIGFPNIYREGIEERIFEDVSTKLNLTDAKRILDIGCGCSDLVEKMISFSSKKGIELFLNDSNEMLSNIKLNDRFENIKFLPGMFPEETKSFQIERKSFDAILVYSVIQYVFNNQSLFGFIHECVKLLNSGGRLLIGDIPNFNAKDRFLNSNEANSFLVNDMKYSIEINHENIDRFDDSLILAILMRFRNFGCETYLLPQLSGLPFANRREDILIIKR